MLGFGDTAQVVEPAALRGSIAAELAAALALYQAPAPEADEADPENGPLASGRNGRVGTPPVMRWRGTSLR